MKPILLALTLAVALVATTRAHELGPGDTAALSGMDEIVISVHTETDGRVYKLALNPVALHQTPAWDGRGAPPLSVGEAGTMAVEQLQASHPEFPEILLDTIILQRTYYHDLDDHWAYQIRARARGRLAHVTVETELQCAVLLDGTVVEPVEVDPETMQPMDEGE